ncbi:MAG: site-specific integrase [Planctomycetaceae bacterium]|nr:site-specific integrase [Planctomycetaceae bacterium]
MPRSLSDPAIRKNSHGKWYCHVSMGLDANGKRVRKYISGDSKNDVRRRKDELVRSHTDGTFAAESPTTLEAFMADWHEVTGVNKGIRTRDNERRDMRLRILPYLGKKRLTDIKPVTLDRWIQQMEKDDHTTHCRHDAFCVLQKSLNYAVKKGMLTVNPCHRAEKPKRPKKKKVDRILSMDEYRRLCNACDGHPMGSLVAVAMLTGFRAGELFALEWDDIDFDQKVIHLSRALTEGEGDREVKETKSGDSRRTAIDDNVIKWLDHRRAHTPDSAKDSPLVFCDQKGGYLRRNNVRYRVWTPIFEAAGLEGITLHSMRHVQASFMIRAGVAPKVVQERLGHARIAITRICTDTFGTQHSGKPWTPSAGCWPRPDLTLASYGQINVKSAHEKARGVSAGSVFIGPNWT